MKKKIQKVLTAVFIILIVITVMVILDSSVDLSSEYVEEAVQKRYSQYIEIFERHREKNAIR